MNKDFKLCYIDGCWAYFTTQDLDKQWGDDWDDVPYEHNAGDPYTPCWHNEPEHINKTIGRGFIKAGELCRCESCKKDWNDDGTPKYEVIKLAFKANGTAQPCDVGSGSSPFSVKGINKGVCAWLWTDDVVINAGCSIDEFKQKIKLMGGDVYEKSV